VWCGGRVLLFWCVVGEDVRASKNTYLPVAAVLQATSSAVTRIRVCVAMILYLSLVLMQVQRCTEFLLPVRVVFLILVPKHPQLATVLAWLLLLVPKHPWLPTVQYWHDSFVI
jgi:hypothetical protein